jgi:hypothetical protein
MKLNNTGMLVIVGVVGVVLGLLLGMLLFWVVFPVEWTDANSYDLSPEAKADYVTLVADSFSLDKDPNRAGRYLQGWTAEEKSQAMADAAAMAEAEARPDKAQMIEDLAMVLGVPAAAAGPEVPVTPEPTPQPGFFDRIRVPCLVFFAVLLVLVLGWIGFRAAVRRRTEAAATPQPTIQPVAVAAPAEDWEGVGQPPLGHFFTTYELGEDTYDDSFSIETPMGEFLGECGVGISETIGTADPDKVTAFEVWLFDKSDIRTITQVLMSEHAYQDDALRARLASKGDAVLAQPGAPFMLETSGLQIRVDVTELIYGQGEEDVPPKSFFDKLTVELVAMTKPPASDDSALL